jgi:hypothetical protein
MNCNVNSYLDVKKEHASLNIKEFLCIIED